MKNLKNRITEWKKQIAKLLGAGALAALACFPVTVHAAPPIVYSLVFTNALDAATVATVNTSTLASTNKWTSGSTTVGFVDTLQSQTVSIEASAVATVNAAGGYTSATNIVNTIVSPDLLTWMPGPQVFFSIGNSNSWQGGWTNADARAWRYIGVTNFVSGGTNCCVSNANFKVKIVLKGP